MSDGYLKAWGNEVKIGEIFQVVSSNSARWTAAKLASNEAERYTYYLVESYPPGKSIGGWPMRVKFAAAIS